MRLKQVDVRGLGYLSGGTMPTVLAAGAEVPEADCRVVAREDNPEFPVPKTGGL
jgi:hypothetical protein